MSVVEEVTTCAAMKPTVSTCLEALTVNVTEIWTSTLILSAARVSNGLGTKILFKIMFLLQQINCIYLQLLKLFMNINCAILLRRQCLW